MTDFAPGIREPEDTDYLPHLTDLEQRIADRICISGTEVGTLHNMLKISVTTMLSRFGLHVDSDDIEVKIVVDRAKEDLDVWPGSEPTPVNLRYIAHHVFQQNSIVEGQTICGDESIDFVRPGFRLRIIHQQVDK